MNKININKAYDKFVKDTGMNVPINVYKDELVAARAFVFSGYEKINNGPLSGLYQNKNTGKIVTRRQALTQSLSEAKSILAEEYLSSLTTKQLNYRRKVITKLKASTPKLKRLGLDNSLINDIKSLNTSRLGVAKQTNQYSNIIAQVTQLINSGSLQNNPEITEYLSRKLSVEQQSKESYRLAATMGYILFGSP